MDTRCRGAGAENANTGRHRDSEAGESEPPSMFGRIPSAKHGARRLMRRSRSLPPTTNGRGHDNAADAPGRATTDAGKRFLTFELPSSTEDLIILLVPFILLAPFCPWCSGSADQPAAMACWISWVSLLFCIYLFFLISSLSPTMGAAQIFLRVSCLAVLGQLAAYAVSPFAGMLLLYLNTFHAAGLLGYALAEHHLSNAPATRCLKNLKSKPSPSVRAGASATPKRKPTRQDPPIVTSLLSIACGVRVLWVCCYLAPSIAVFEASTAVGICLFLKTCYLHYWPMDQLYIDLEGLFKLAGIAVMSLALYASMGGNLFGEFGEVFGVWFTVAGMAGFLGYSLALCHCHKQLVKRQGDSADPCSA